MSIPILVIDHDRTIDKGLQAHLLVEPISDTTAAHTKLDLTAVVSLLMKPTKGVFPIILVSTPSKKARLPCKWAFLPMPLTNVGHTFVSTIKRSATRKRKETEAAAALGDSSASWRQLRSSPAKKLAASPSGDAAASTSGGAPASSSGATASPVVALQFAETSKRVRPTGNEPAPDEVTSPTRRVKKLRLVKNTQVSKTPSHYRRVSEYQCVSVCFSSCQCVSVTCQNACINKVIYMDM